MVWSHFAVPLLVLFSVLSLPFPSAAASINVTVDDQNGDEVTKAMPTYSPSTVWNYGPSCSGCLLKPDPFDTYDKSWHDSTRRPGHEPFTIEISFTGFAVYVYIILPAYVYDASLNTNISFHLDSNIVGTYNHNPGYSPNYQYNYLVYSNANLDNTNHTFVLSLDADIDKAVVLFDRLVYSSGDPSSPPSVTSTWAPPTGNPLYTPASTTTASSGGSTLAPLDTPDSDNNDSTDGQTSSDSPATSHGVIIGASIAGAGCCVVASVIFCCVRQRRRQAVGTSAPPFFRARRKRPRTMSHGSIEDSERGLVTMQQTSSSSTPLSSPHTESLAAAPAYSTITRREDTLKPPPAIIHGHDPFQRDEVDEKLERLVRPPSFCSRESRTRSNNDRSRPLPPTRVETGRHGVRRERANEHALINHIATLQADVDLLRDSRSILSDPPPYERRAT